MSKQGGETLRKLNALLRRRADDALTPLRDAACKPFEGRKLTVAELCAECGLIYEEGKVHTPDAPILRRAA